MPLPEVSFLCDGICAAFRGRQLKLPAAWPPAHGDLAQQFRAGEYAGSKPDTRCLFQTASVHHYHGAAARELSGRLERYILGISQALHHGLELWLGKATIEGVVVNGACGIVAGGAVTGPALAPLVMQCAPQGSVMELKYSHAVATALQQAWQEWSWGLQGILSYPALALVSAPQAPPTANTPVNLLQLQSDQEMLLAADALGADILHRLTGGEGAYAPALCYAIGAGIHNTWLELRQHTRVINVYASGPVPGFLPPSVPAAPVVNGQASGLAGCFQ